MIEGSNERYAKDLRKLVQQTSAVAIFSVLTAVIVIPMIYNYSQHIETALDSEVRFCNHRTTDLLLEFTRLENGYKGRQKRAARLSRRHRLRIHNLQQRFAAGRYDHDAEGVFSGKQQNPSSDYRLSTSTAYAKPYDAVISGYGDSSLINAASSSVMQRQNAPCSCNIGPAGPPGPPGMDGRDGEFFRAIHIYASNG
uniref:Col_cuticle_N domain-containing protein n=1 Tax=Ascaris lumbricoides TaxID=6252 RepID=A0A0M3HFZ0_ASCLU